MSVLDKWITRSSQMFRPMQATLELTNRCNERCSHCYIPSFKDDPQRVLSLEQWQKVLRELREAGVLYVILMGGEAMLNRHFFSIASYADELGFHVGMITNGLLINRARAEKLKESGLRNITFSLYSMRSEVHDAMTRVKGSWLRTQSAMQACRDVGLKVTVNCLLTKANTPQAIEVADWCFERGIEFRFDPQVTPRLDHDLTPLVQRASREQLLGFYRELGSRWPNAIASQSSPMEEDAHICNAAKGKCAVSAYGELLACVELREPLGSLVDHSFSELWQRDGAQEFRNIKVADFPAELDRTELSACSHCPGMALHENDDPLHVSDFSRMIVQVKKQAASLLCKA